jgi:hypothetical protein
MSGQGFLLAPSPSPASLHRRWLPKAHSVRSRATPFTLFISKAARPLSCRMRDILSPRERGSDEDFGRQLVDENHILGE